MQKNAKKDIGKHVPVIFVIKALRLSVARTNFFSNMFFHITAAMAFIEDDIELRRQKERSRNNIWMS